MTGDADPSGTPAAATAPAMCVAETADLGPAAADLVAAAADLVPAAVPRPASRPVTAPAAAIPVRLLRTRFPPMLSLLARHAAGGAGRPATAVPATRGPRSANVPFTFASSHSGADRGIVPRGGCQLGANATMASG